MTEAIIVAIITGGLTLFGTVITSISAARKTEQGIKTSQAITEEKIAELTREVQEHNGFARRMPVVEEQIKEINHRIDDIERKER